MIHFRVVHKVKSEGIFNDDVPPYCSCVQSGSSCTGSTVKKVILTSGKFIEEDLNSYYWETYRGGFM